jgi:rubrerythrin
MKSELVHAIEKAIGKEKEAYEFYLGLMNKADTPNQKDFFKTLAIQEMKHESLLKELRRTGDLMRARLQMQMRYSMDAEFSFNPTVSTSGLQEGFQIAIKRELMAQKDYLEAAQFSDSEEMRQLFIALYEEEKGHEALLRAEYSKGFG